MNARLPASPGMPLAEVETPALVLEMDAMESNLGRMAQALAGRGVRLRAHAKAHKSPDIARRQVAAGAAGVCCQTVAEAEAMVEGGIRDVLVTNEIVTRSKLARLAALAGRATVGVCVDDAGAAGLLAAACAAAGTRIDVYVEVDVGARRCGVQPGAPALDLARAVAGHASLRFAGLQAYQGGAQHLRTLAERRAAIASAAEAAHSTKKLLEREGIPCPRVTGAGTGTFAFEIETGAWNEIQPGSYVFMDADYARNEAGGPLPRFEHALFVLATVISRPSADRAVLDAGLKAFAADSGPPLVWERPGVVCEKLNDEHGLVRIAAGAAAPALGERLLLVPGHCDPTVNLHDWYVCVRKGVVEALWPVAARGGPG